jgi:hypothetical protein
VLEAHIAPLDAKASHGFGKSINLAHCLSRPDQVANGTPLLLALGGASPFVSLKGLTTFGLPSKNHALKLLKNDIEIYPSMLGIEVYCHEELASPQACG